MFLKFQWLLIINILFSSCGSKSDITPLFPARKASYQQKSNFYTVSGSYVLDDIDVKKTIEGPIIYKDIASLLADIFILIGGGVDVEMSPVPVDISDLDLDVVKEAYIDSVYFEIADDEKSSKATLKFLKNLTIYIAESADSKIEEKNWLFKYDSKNPFTQKRNEYCKFRCIKLNVNHINLLKFSQNNKNDLFIIPFVEVGKTTKTDFTLKGKVKFELKLFMPI